ncbi:MAG: lamin tail domain-containing protein, partial [Verrucomicrobiota bacterium]
MSGLLHEDPRFLGRPEVTDPGQLRDDLRLGPGSPALGAGAGGLDLGALIPPGIHLAGTPAGTTWRTGVTLTPAGPGLTAYRWRLNDGPWSAELPLSSPVVLAGLTNGTHQVRAIGRNSAGAWASEADAFTTPAWRVDTASGRVRLHEILAHSRRHEPDRIELHNDSPEPADLSGWSLTDSPALPRRLVFPPGTLLPPDGLLVVVADEEDPAGDGLHTGFGLEARGETLELRRPDGTLADAVTFGLQVADFSLGRQADGTWVLGTPTFGAPNRPARTGDPQTLRINEWLAASDRLFAADYLELDNPDPLPVALGGLHLTDNPVGRPRAHVIAALSFVEGRGQVA